MHAVAFPWLPFLTTVVTLLIRDLFFSDVRYSVCWYYVPKCWPCSSHICIQVFWPHWWCRAGIGLIGGAECQRVRPFCSILDETVTVSDSLKAPGKCSLYSFSDHSVESIWRSYSFSMMETLLIQYIEVSWCVHLFSIVCHLTIPVQAGMILCILR